MIKIQKNQLEDTNKNWMFMLNKSEGSEFRFLKRTSLRFKISNSMDSLLFIKSIYIIYLIYTSDYFFKTTILLI